MLRFSSLLLTLLLAPCPSPTTPSSKKTSTPAPRLATHPRPGRRRSGYRSPWIEGYCSKQSVAAGESIDIMVSDRPAAPVRDRDLPHGLLRRPRCPADEDARPVRRPDPADPRTRRQGPPRMPLGAGHHASTIPDDWPSGVYLGRLTTIADPDDEPYWQSYVVFIVRDDRPADILFQCSDNTWQAYNRWPSHYSVYTHPKGDPGPLGRRQLRPALRPGGPVRRRRQRPAHRRLGRVPALRVPAGLLAGTARLRRHLLLQQRHAHPRPRPRSARLHQRRPRRVLGHPPVPQRRSHARRRRQPAVPLRQCRLLGHPACAQQRRPPQPHHVPRRSLRRRLRLRHQPRESSTARSPNTAPTRATDRAPATSSPSTAAATGSSPSPTTGSSPAPA